MTSQKTASRDWVLSHFKLSEMTAAAIPEGWTGTAKEAMSFPVDRKMALAIGIKAAVMTGQAEPLRRLLAALAGMLHWRATSATAGRSRSAHFTNLVRGIQDATKPVGRPGPNEADALLKWASAQVGAARAELDETSERLSRIGHTVCEVDDLHAKWENVGKTELDKDVAAILWACQASLENTARAHERRCQALRNTKDLGMILLGLGENVLRTPNTSAIIWVNRAIGAMATFDMIGTEGTGAKLEELERQHREMVFWMLLGMLD